MTENLDENNTKQRPGTVDKDVSLGRSPSGNKGLVEFICAGKSCGQQSGQKKEPEAPDSVYIQRERYTYGQNAVFCHVSQFSYRQFNFVGIGIFAFFRQIFIQNPVCCGYNLITDFMA